MVDVDVEGIYGQLLGMHIEIPCNLQEYHDRIILLQQYQNFCNSWSLKLSRDLFHIKDPEQKKMLQQLRNDIDQHYSHLVKTKQNFNMIINKGQRFEKDGEAPKVVSRFENPPCDAVSTQEIITDEDLNFDF